MFKDFFPPLKETIQATSHPLSAPVAHVDKTLKAIPSKSARAFPVFVRRTPVELPHSEPAPLTAERSHSFLPSNKSQRINWNF